MLVQDAACVVLRAGSGVLAGNIRGGRVAAAGRVGMRVAVRFSGRVAMSLPTRRAAHA